jgi:preprotein translocase subunit SecE
MGTSSPGRGSISLVQIFLREVREELARVTWPTRKELAAYSIVVVVAVAVLGSLVFGLDQLLFRTILRLFGR